MNWDELYALLNQQNLVEDLRARGYDAVVLDFTDATDYIQRNAFVRWTLLHKVQAAVAPTRLRAGGPEHGRAGRALRALVDGAERRSRTACATFISSTCRTGAPTFRSASSTG